MSEKTRYISGTLNLVIHFTDVPVEPGDTDLDAIIPGEIEGEILQEDFDITNEFKE